MACRRSAVRSRLAPPNYQPIQLLLLILFSDFVFMPNSVPNVAFSSTEAWSMWMCIRKCHSNVVTFFMPTTDDCTKRPLCFLQTDDRFAPPSRSCGSDGAYPESGPLRSRACRSATVRILPDTLTYTPLSNPFLLVEAGIFCSEFDENACDINNGLAIASRTAPTQIGPSFHFFQNRPAIRPNKRWFRSPPGTNLLSERPVI